MVRSEDQEEELLSSVIVSGLSKKGSNVGEKVLVGGGNGVLTLWERGVWDDQDERITVDRSKGGGESLDSLALLPPGIGPGGKIAAVGLGNGDIRFVKIGQNKVVAELKHDELEKEAVIGLGFDVTGRMISGGGRTVKVWGEHGALAADQDDDDDDDDDEEDDDDDEEQEEKDDKGTEETGTKRDHSDDSDADSDSDMDSSDEEQQSKRKKRKKNKGKQQKGHGILKFSGLD